MTRQIMVVVALGCYGLAVSAMTAQSQDQLAAQFLTVEQAEAMDRDRDGTISRAEFEAQSKSSVLFERADRNGDDRLDAAELRAVLAVAPRTIR